MSFWSRGFAAALVLTGGMMAGVTVWAATAAPPPTTFTLDNGLDVVVIEDHRAPVVTHMVWYRVGAADEPPGKSGIAHFLEHLMFKGTDTVPEGQFSATVAKNGGQENAFTSWDFTGYFQRVAKDRLGLVMELESDRMAHLNISEEAVATEREVIIEERRSRTENDPGSLLGEEMSAALYRNHPYGTPVIGWMHEMAGLTRADALDFYKRHYTPTNAILIVAGDVTPDEVRALAEKTYGVLPRGETIARVRPQEPPFRATIRLSYEDARVASPSVIRRYVTPSYATAEPGVAEAMDVAMEILGGGATSRLYRALVIEQGIAANVGAFYSGSGLDSATAGFYGMPVPGVSVETLEAAIDAEITKFLEEGPTEAEVTRAKNSLIASAIYARDSQSTLARIYGSALTQGQTVADVLAWPDRIEAVTTDRVAPVARDLLKIEKSVTGVLKPRPQS